MGESSTPEYVMPFIDARLHLAEAIKQVYEAHYRDVYRFLVSFTGNRTDAEDLTQEVFLRIMKSIGNYKKDYRLKTWILSIARHVAIDHYRRQRRILAWVPDAILHMVAPDDEMPERALESKELSAMIQEAVLKLKPQYRAVCILRGINEVSIKEAAQILGCSESKVKVDFHRALAYLRKTIPQEMMEVPFRE